MAVAAWTGLPSIQRATGAARTGVADAGFGGRLPTWQNPSFTRAPSPAVLNPAAGDSLLSGAFDAPDRRTASTPLSPPRGTPPVQRMPVAPLRAIPVDSAEPGALGPSTGSMAPARTSASGAPPRTPGTRRGASAPAPTPPPASTPTVQRAARSTAAAPSSSGTPAGTPSRSARGVRVTPVPPATPQPRQALTRAPSGASAVQRRSLPASRRTADSPPESSGTAPTSTDGDRAGRLAAPVQRAPRREHQPPATADAPSPSAPPVQRAATTGATAAPGANTPVPGDGSGPLPGTDASSGVPARRAAPGSAGAEAAAQGGR
ncbi:hypothetical protein ACWEWK_27545 [Streptomyces sp. NPDC003757]